MYEKQITNIERHGSLEIVTGYVTKTSSDITLEDEAFINKHYLPSGQLRHITKVDGNKAYFLVQCDSSD